MIYFLLAETVGHIKIGFTADGLDPGHRLADLQTGSPVKLDLLGTLPGGRDTERELHRRFASAHVRGEWFRPVPELLAFIGKRVEMGWDLQGDLYFPCGRRIAKRSSLLYHAEETLAQDEALLAAVQLAISRKREELLALRPYWNRPGVTKQEAVNAYQADHTGEAS